MYVHLKKFPNMIFFYEQGNSQESFKWNASWDSSWDYISGELKKETYHETLFPAIHVSYLKFAKFFFLWNVFR